jgi:hypothetical protein
MRSTGQRALRGAMVAAVAVSWLSAAIFGAYILAFYGGALHAGTGERWNTTLPGLYEPRTAAATLAIGIHFAMGGILLLLGPVQLIARVRQRWPALHRWIGRTYALAALLVGIGGLTFIFGKGTVGGTPMNIGFAGYGVLVVVSALQTYRHARTRDLERHRAWAIRLYALAIGSWLYRMDYALWAMVGHLAGHARTFDGWFDVVMSFMFYVPNLAIAELAIRQRPSRPAVRTLTTIVLILAALFVAVATAYFTMFAWGPGIVGAFG